MGAGHRRYSVTYALNSADGIKRLLTDLHRLRSGRFERGDYAASDILIDLDRAIIDANLTVRQRQAVYYVYEEDLRQVDAAAYMGVSQQAIDQFMAIAVDRIAAVYERWGYGEIEVVYVESSEEDAELNTIKNDGERLNEGTI